MEGTVVKRFVFVMHRQRQAKQDAERGRLRRGGRNLPRAAIHYEDS